MEGLLSSGLLRCFALAGKGNEPEERMGRNLRSHKALRCYQEDKTPPGYLWTPIPGFIQNTIPHPTVAYEGGMLRSAEHTTLSPGPMSRRRDHALVFCSHVKAPICRQRTLLKRSRRGWAASHAALVARACFYTCDPRWFCNY